MSKWIENNKARALEAARTRRDKLEEEYAQYDREYRDFPYDRYWKAMERREAEINELKEYIEFLKGNDQELNDYKDAVKELRALLGKVHLICTKIDPSDRVSSANLTKLISITGHYAGDFYDPSIAASAERGIW